MRVPGADGGARGRMWPLGSRTGAVLRTGETRAAGQLKGCRLFPMEEMPVRRR